MTDKLTWYNFETKMREQFKIAIDPIVTKNKSLEQDIKIMSVEFQNM